MRTSLVRWQRHRGQEVKVSTQILKIMNYKRNFIKRCCSSKSRDAMKSRGSEGHSKRLA
jgi:hypothetical protein